MTLLVSKNKIIVQVGILETEMSVFEIVNLVCFFKKGFGDSSSFYFNNNTISRNHITNYDWMHLKNEIIVSYAGCVLAFPIKLKIKKINITFSRFQHKNIGFVKYLN
ncbi:hypothetical protein AAHE18_19G037100 [Arachis hypogaea]